jgi:hypothetical protein
MLPWRGVGLLRHSAVQTAAAAEQLLLVQFLASASTSTPGWRSWQTMQRMLSCGQGPPRNADLHLQVTDCLLHSCPAGVIHPQKVADIFAPAAEAWTVLHDQL